MRWLRVAFTVHACVSHVRVRHIATPHRQTVHVRSLDNPRTMFRSLMRGGIDEELAAEVDLYSVLDVPLDELLEDPPVATASGVTQVSQDDGGSDQDETEAKEDDQPAPATPLGPFTSSAMAPISPLPAVSVPSSHDGSADDEDTEEEAGMPPEVDRGSMDKPMLQRGTGPTMNAQVDQPVPLAGQGPMGAIATDKPASPEDGGPVEVAWVADVGRPGPVAGTGSAQHQAIGEIVAYGEDAEDVKKMERHPRSTGAPWTSPCFSAALAPL